MIGIGLDAVTEDLFRNMRTEVPAGGLKWTKYWEIVREAREVFGPWKVNVHTLVGLGERDADLIDLFCRLRDEQIFSYLFCFNPGAGFADGHPPEVAYRSLAPGPAGPASRSRKPATAWPTSSSTTTATSSTWAATVPMVTGRSPAASHS